MYKRSGLVFEDRETRWVSLHEASGCLVVAIHYSTWVCSTPPLSCEHSSADGTLAAEAAVVKRRKRVWHFVVLCCAVLRCAYRRLSQYSAIPQLLVRWRSTRNKRGELEGLDLFQAGLGWAWVCVWVWLGTELG